MVEETTNDLALDSDIPGRVRRLPKPQNAEQSLQPTYEAVINAVHAVIDKFGEESFHDGKISVDIIFDPEKPDEYSATIKDNGIGLDVSNWDAFRRPDTVHKIRRGGKGVGRLLWLSAFKRTTVESSYLDGEEYRKRTFDFLLDDEKQIVNHENTLNGKQTGTRVEHFGLAEHYASKFPRKTETLVSHFVAHFVAVLVNINACNITLNYNSEFCDLNKHFDELTLRSDTADIVIEIGSEDFSFQLGLLVCDKSVVYGPSKNYLHFIANDRTVRSKSVDDMLGFHAFGGEEDQVFQGYIKGEFLDQNVNQERTGFIFSEDILSQITRKAISEAQTFLSEPIKVFKQKQVESVKAVFQRYPSLKVYDVESVITKLPTGSSREEDVVKTLSIERYRFDQKLIRKIDDIITNAQSGEDISGSLAEEIIETTDSIQEDEKRSLAEYVVRRQTLLTYMEKMLSQIKKGDGKSAYQREDLLHRFICPMRVEGDVLAPDDHDLWIVDEALAFSEFFASDLEFSKFLKDTDSDERPDLVFFYESCLGLANENEDTRSSVVLFELKQPNRTNYKAGDNPHDQVFRYISRIIEGNCLDANGRTIKVTDQTTFTCYIIAVLVGPFGKVVESNYRRSPDGKSHIHEFQGNFKGFIKLIEWDDVVAIARQKNEAFFRRLGIST